MTTKDVVDAVSERVLTVIERNSSISISGDGTETKTGETAVCGASRAQLAVERIHTSGSEKDASNTGRARSGRELYQRQHHRMSFENVVRILFHV